MSYLYKTNRGFKKRINTTFKLGFGPFTALYSLIFSKPGGDRDFATPIFRALGILASPVIIAIGIVTGILAIGAAILQSLALVFFEYPIALIRDKISSGKNQEERSGEKEASSNNPYTSSSTMIGRRMGPQRCNADSAALTSPQNSTKVFAAGSDAANNFDASSNTSPASATTLWK